MMKNLFIICTFIIALSACKQYSAEYKQAQLENDSLKLQLKKNEVELNEMLGILNDIENDIQSIREAEDYINIQKDAELTDSKRSLIKKNMDLIVETLKKNRQQLSELQEKLNSSNVKLLGLQKTIDRITKELGEKSELVVKLQTELSRKDEEIKDLTVQVEGLNTDIKILKDVNESQSELLTEQDQTINTVYYCFGTKKELKEQNILTGGGLFSKDKVLDGNFNRNYFISIDKRRVTEIPLYSGKATVVTNHNRNAYRLIKDNDGNFTLKITDPDKFWSLSKFLVVVVG